MNLCYVAVYFNLKIYHSPIKQVPHINLVVYNPLIFYAVIVMFDIIQNIVILYASFKFVTHLSAPNLHCIAFLCVMGVGPEIISPLPVGSMLGSAVEALKGHCNKEQRIDLSSWSDWAFLFVV